MGGQASSSPVVEAPATATTARAERRADRGLARHIPTTFALTALTLGVNLVTGVLIARALGASGRGELTAILTITQMVGWAFALGCRQAVSYRVARSPGESGKLISTWLVLVLPLGLVAVVVGELLLPTLFAAQTDGTQDLARLFVLSAVFVPIADLVWGVLLGDHDFLFCNLMAFAQPAVVALVLLGLWGTGAFSIESALLATLAASLVALGFSAARALRRHHLGRPSRVLARETLWYAVRAHGTNVAGMANLRLDLLIIPAFLAASSVGLYAVATSVSWLVATLAGALGAFVLPAAAREGGRRGTRTVLQALYATFAVGVVVAAVLGAVAGIGVRLVYGAAFDGSVTPLRLLLPGCVALAAAGVLSSGLYALARPLSALVAQVAGMGITVVGLLLFLEEGGITAAAIVSTLSYLVVLLASLVLYRRFAGLAWSDFRMSRSELMDGLRPRKPRTGAGL